MIILANTTQSIENKTFNEHIHICVNATLIIKNSTVNSNISGEANSTIRTIG